MLIPGGKQRTESGADRDSALFAASAHDETQRRLEALIAPPLLN
jgi:hypothetical protein